MPKTGLGGYEFHMRSVNADKKIYKLAADPEYRAKKPNAPMVKKRIGEMERGCGINPILDIILKNKKVKSLREDKRYKEQVEKWRKLLADKNPWLNEKIPELFEMYDFVVSEPEQKDFFDFKISARLRADEPQQEWKPKQEIVVILQKLYGKINETDMRVYTTKLQKRMAVIITIENNNPLDFSYDTDKICLIDKELLECLLYYRIDVIKRYALYHAIMKKKKI
jgi:hypothetical protein